MEELQDEEREVILSIYDCDPAFKQLSPVTYQYKFGEEGDPRSFLLEIVWGKEYPNEVPNVNMNTFYNKHINESTKKKVCEYVCNEALNLVGNAMTYSLFEGVKEKYLDLIVDDPDCKLSPDSPEDNDVNEDDEDDDDDDDESKELEQGTSQKKDKKCHLTKAQKRKQWNRVDCHGERPRGWNWIDVIHHLSQTGPKNPENQASS
ncbi:RWD domain-containing protein 4 [Halyomorpha halys]|uniref:RWD domain-containing protein 4 n=1 Tax=Halyomorpha halys TaxID=286706 RepID=UPI0006D50653|nr:RWD domain-containing protein 4 [Halyomorpha halys]